jgi:hypothetical protein
MLRSGFCFLNLIFVSDGSFANMKMQKEGEPVV